MPCSGPRILPAASSRSARAAAASARANGDGSGCCVGSDGGTEDWVGADTSRVTYGAAAASASRSANSRRVMGSLMIRWSSEQMVLRTDGPPASFEHEDPPSVGYEGLKSLLGGSAS